MEQARALYLIAVELGMTADVALHLDAGDAEVTRRLLARAALEHRTDDTAQVIAQRLALYLLTITKFPSRGTRRDQVIPYPLDQRFPWAPSVARRGSVPGPLS